MSNLINTKPDANIDASASTGIKTSINAGVNAGICQPPLPDVVALYEEVARITGNMLSAAHQQDWEQLVALEAGCANCIESLKGCTVPVMLSEEARLQKVSLIKTILANDREIRKLTDPWMQHVAHLLESAHAQCRVNKRYGLDAS